MTLNDIDEQALDAEVAACCGDEDALTSLVKRHLAEAAYIFANLMEAKISMIPPDIPVPKAREQLLPALQNYQEWVFESLFIERFERLGVSRH